MISYGMVALLVALLSLWLVMDLWALQTVYRHFLSIESALERLADKIELQRVRTQVDATDLEQVTRRALTGSCETTREEAPAGGVDKP